MPRTRTDLVTEVLQLLGVTQVGQPISAEDAEVVGAKIGSVFARLARRNVLYVQDDAIDDEYFDTLAVIVANNVGPKFGQSFDPATDVMQEARRREIQQEPGADDTVRACYF